MARYERGDEFWEIVRDGARITITAGVIGTPGTTTVEYFASPQFATTRFNVLQNQRVREGWRLSKPPKPVVEMERPIAKAPPVFDARNLDLERAILEDPLNDEPFAVYGDWLESQNDPRGEVISLMLAQVRNWSDHEVGGKLARLEEKYGEYLRGTIELPEGWRLGLRYGFVGSLEALAGPFLPTLDRVFDLETTRFATSVQLDDDGQGGLVKALATVARRAPSTLRSLDLGGNTRLPNLDAIADRLPELTVFGLVNISDRKLAVGLPCLETLAEIELPRLRVLTLELFGGNAIVGPVTRLLSRTDLPNLRRLYFRTSNDEAIAETLVRCSLAGQLESVSFEYPGGQHVNRGEGDRVAALLIEHRARFSATAEVGIPHGHLSPPTLAALQAAFPKVRDADGQERYQNSVE